MTFLPRQNLAAKLSIIVFILGIGLLFIGALNSSSSARESHTPKISPLDFTHSEYISSDNVMHYRRWRTTDATSTLLWLTITHSSQSWGTQKTFVWTTERTFEDYLGLISAQVDVNTTSLGLLTSSRNEYEYYKSAIQKHDFATVNILLHPGYDHTLMVDRENRHDKAVQTRRRAELSKLRNYLMLETLEHEDHILWLDADVYYLDPNIVKRMIQHSTEQSDTGLLTARCAGKGIDDYDRNAWRGTRQGPRGWDLDKEEIVAGELKLQGQKHIADFYKNTSSDHLIGLTTVGATILYIRASLVRQGLSFPHQYVVGTRWGKDGWDGIESEGLCYRSRGLDGGKCAFLGGGWHVKHTSD